MIKLKVQNHSNISTESYTAESYSTESQTTESTENN